MLWRRRRQNGRKKKRQESVKKRNKLGSRRRTSRISAARAPSQSWRKASPPPPVVTRRSLANTVIIYHLKARHSTLLGGCCGFLRRPPCRLEPSPGFLPPGTGRNAHERRRRNRVRYQGPPRLSREGGEGGRNKRINARPSSDTKRERERVKIGEKKHTKRTSCTIAQRPGVSPLTSATDGSVSRGRHLHGARGTKRRRGHPLYVKSKAPPPRLARMRDRERGK